MSSVAVGSKAAFSPSACVFRKTQFRQGSRQCRDIARCKVQASSVAYKAPSYSTAATELEALQRWTQIVPDTVLMQHTPTVETLAEAATVSSAVLHGILQSPSGQIEQELAISRAVNYERCRGLEDGARVSCEIDKALVNVGALYASKVSGRVSTEVDPRLANDTGKLVAKAQSLLEMYDEMKVSRDKLVMRVPGTWAGIQAAKQLEAQGIATHVILVCSFVQVVAAAQAGVSVLQPNVGRIADWFAKNPGAIRDPKGPREDTGFSNSDNPGLKLVERMYCYCKQHGPKTALMVAGLRHKEDALALAGVDYLVLSPRILLELRNSPTLQGYNDGLTTQMDNDSVPARLSAEAAAAMSFSAEELQPVTEQSFRAGLGPLGSELLEKGVADLVESVARLEPDFRNFVVGSE